MPCCAPFAVPSSPPRPISAMSRRVPSDPSPNAPCGALRSSGPLWSVHSTFRLGQRRSLEDLRPAKASYVLALLRQIRGCGLVSASCWCDAFLDEALRFRVMLPRVRVRDASPSPPRSVPWNIYASHVELSRAPAHFGPDGVLEVHLDLRLDAVIRDSETTRWTHTVEAQFPHESRVVALDGARARELWLREAQHALSHPLRSAQRHALEGALTLVRLSGIVPALRDEPCAVIGGSLVV